MEEPPIISELLNIGSDPADHTVSVVLGVGGGRGTVVHLHLKVIGALVGALVAEAAKLNSEIPESERLEHVPLNVEAARIGVGQDGVPMMLFELRGGTIMPLAMEKGDFAGLAAEMALLAEKPNGQTH